MGQNLLDLYGGHSYIVGYSAQSQRRITRDVFSLSEDQGKYDARTEAHQQLNDSFGADLVIAPWPSRQDQPS